MEVCGKGGVRRGGNVKLFRKGMIQEREKEAEKEGSRDEKQESK